MENAELDRIRQKLASFPPYDWAEDVEGLLAAVVRLLEAGEAAYHALKSYQYGNSAPDLAKETADRLEVALSQSRGLITDN